MTCKAISDANPDIAGLGIILAFGLQALVSLLLSATARALLSKHLPLIKWDRKRFWKELVGTRRGYSESIAVTTDKQTFIKNVLRLTPGPDIGAIYGFWTDIRHAMETVDPIDTEASKAKKAAVAIVERIMKRISDEIKDGINLSFPSGFENHVVDFLDLSQIIVSARREAIAENRRNRILSDVSKEITTKQEKVQELICRILLVASDAQTVTGIALIITAMAQQKSLSLYHLHVIYDTINFTTVSNLAAMSCVYDNRLESQRVRYLSITIFGLLYFGFTIMLGIRLNDWNDEEPGRCYNASRIALPNAKHPLDDQVYLGITSAYVFSMLLIVTIYCRVQALRLYWQKSVITVGAMQFILHIYILVALRISNQSLLDNVALEDQWGFGQVIAIVMLVATLLECAKGLEEYFAWKKKEAADLKEKAKLEERQATLNHAKTFP